MPSLWSAYPRILTLSPAPFEAVKDAKNGLWFSLRLFLLAALVANLAGLAAIPAELAPPTLAERVEGLARRIEETIPIFPWFLAGPLEELVAGIDRVAGQIQSFQPPLGARPSRLLRLVGAWLERPLDLLASWLGLALATWVVARFMGGKGSIRAHLSLVLLAAAPLPFFLVHDLLAEVFASGLALTYVGWAFRLALWVWCALILVRAVAIAQRFPPDRAVAALILSALLSLIFTVLPLAFIAILLVTLV